MLAQQSFVTCHGFGIASDASAGRGVEREDVFGVVGVVVLEPLGFVERLCELLHPHEDVDVLNAGVLVRGVEFDAAFEQELGLVVGAVAGGHLGEQAHALGVGLVVAQEVFAGALGIGEAVVG